MNRILLIFLTIFSTNVTLGQDLEILQTFFNCTQELDKREPTIVIGMTLKNISDTNIRLITKLDSVTIIPKLEETPANIHITKSVLSKDGALLIVPMSTLDLVELYPGDATIVGYRMSLLKDPATFIPTINRAAIIFRSDSDFYGGRYGIWHGTVKSEELSLENEEVCLP